LGSGRPSGALRLRFAGAVLGLVSDLGGPNIPMIIVPTRLMAASTRQTVNVLRHVPLALARASADAPA
jgi:hypothetical protein